MIGGYFQLLLRQIIFAIWHISLRLNKYCSKIMETEDIPASEVKANASPKTPPNTMVITPVMLARRPSSLRRIYSDSEARGNRKLTPLPKNINRNLFGTESTTPKLCLFGLAPHLADEVEQDRKFRLSDQSRDSSRLL